MQPAPRDSPVDAFRANPLSWLTAAARPGPVAVIDPERAVLTRDPAATSSVAVFGTAQLRAVLGDLDRFRMPLSVAVRDGLPDALVNLNSGVFSMTGEVHRERQQVLANILAAQNGQAYEGALSAVIESAVADAVDAGAFDLLTWARDLTGQVAERLVLGAAGAGTATFVRRYFDLRRRHSAVPTPELRSALINAGTELDDLLRERIRTASPTPSAGGVIGELVSSERAWRSSPSEDELVAHANILMASTSEPVATSLAWHLLILTQRTRLAAGLRTEIAADRDASIPVAVDHSVLESLRLVPANAVMARVSTRDARLAGVDIPGGTEVVLSPYVEHRNPAVYPDPNRFDATRWRTTRPTPFQFLPFGVGARACLGRRIARYLLGRVVTAVLARSVPIMVRDTPVDWRMSVTLAPVGDLPMLFSSAIPPGRSGKVLGSARMLLG